MRTLLILTLLASAPESSRPAPAESSAEQNPTEAAKHLFTQGAQLYADGDLPGARFAFERAFELSSNYKILYNLAVVELELHDYASAKETFERYLQEGGDAIDASRRAEVEAELEGLADRVGQVRITVSPSDAVVTLDGERTELSADGLDTHLNLGVHTVKAAAPGYASKEERFEVEGGAVTELTLQLEQEDVPPPSTASTRPPEPDDDLSRRTRRLRIGSWVSAGAAGVFGVAAFVTGMLALRAEDDLSTERGMVPADRPAIDDAQQRVRNLATTTDVFIGIGAVAGATAIGLGIAAWRSSKRETSGVRARASGLEVRF